MSGFTAEQLQQMESVVTKAIRREFTHVGIVVSSDADVIELRKDFAFNRALRFTLNGLAAKIGWAVMLVVLGGVFWIGKLGLDAWKAATGG